MIINKVSTLIGARRTTVAEVAKKAKVSYEAISRLYDGTSKRLDFETLDKLCEALGCQPGDLFEHAEG
jgi:putative transcriptional regulator